MEDDGSNCTAQHSTAQHNFPINFNQSTADFQMTSRIRPSKRVKLEREIVGDLAGSDSADLYCNVCDLPFTEPTDLLLHIRNSLCHEDIARNSEKRKIDEHVEQVEQIKHIEYKSENHSWSEILAHDHPQVLEALQARCHSNYDLQSRSYVLRRYTEEDCAGLTKCGNCRRLQSDLERREDSKCTFHPGKRPFKKNGGGERPYSCCGKPGKGCQSRPTHSYGLPDPKYQEFATTPDGSLEGPKRRAVALDCEMVTVQTTTVPYKASELIFFCAVDYLTGETLMNIHVRPQRKVIDWCTRYSGVTAHTMAEAEAQGQTLDGWQDARSELWKHIDADTILVGQSLQNDLEVLRMIHTRVVDSAILTRLAVGFGGTREWGLKVLCEELLGMKIQTNGGKGHVCAEDTFATREVVLFCCHYPERLETWAMVKRKEQEEQQRIQKEASENAKREKARVREEEQKIREEALEKAMIERAKVNEKLAEIRREGSETADGSASKGEEVEMQEKEDELWREVRSEGRRRRRRNRQERKARTASKSEWSLP